MIQIDLIVMTTITFLAFALRLHFGRENAYQIGSGIGIAGAMPILFGGAKPVCQKNRR